MTLQKLVGKTYWLITAASTPWSFPAMVAGWPLVEMTGKQEHIVHHHIFISDIVLNLMILTEHVKEIALTQNNIHHDHYPS